MRRNAMKKSSSILFAVVIGAAMLAGCGHRKSSGGPATPAVTGTPTEQTAAAQQPTAQPTAKGNPTIATVVRSTDNWSKLVETGVKKFGQDNPNVTVFQRGPEKAEGALQATLIEELIAQKPDGLCVIPVVTGALDRVLKQAMADKIVVVTNEGFTAKNMDLDIEAFDNAAYGPHLMDELAKRMGEEGEYAVYVGSLSSSNQNQWADAAIAWQKLKYPQMKLVVDKVETSDDSKQAYEKTMALLKAHPNIKGFLGNAWTDVAGIGQAIEEGGLQDKTVVVGTSLVSTASKYLSSGAVDMIAFWDPAAAGYACNKLALMLVNGEKPKEGMDLGVPGYSKLQQKDKVFYGQAWIDVTKDNTSQYNY
jgi:simple sugar transport system substrate-binding protein